MVIVNWSRNRVPGVASTATRSVGTLITAVSNCSRRCRVTDSASPAVAARGTGITTTTARPWSASAWAATVAWWTKSPPVPASAVSSVPAWLASWTSPCSGASMSSNAGSSMTARSIACASCLATECRPAPIAARIASLALGVRSFVSISATRSLRLCL
jgi:hypothetical protein